MIDNFSFAVVLLVACVLVVGLVARCRSGTVAAHPGPIAAVIVGTGALVAFDWWNVHSIDDLALDAYLGGMTQFVHRWTLGLMIGWTAVVVVVVVIRGGRRGALPEMPAETP